MFEKLRKEIGERAEQILSSEKVVRLDVDPELIWETYLENIPKEHNPIFRQRRRYDGSYDRHFVKTLGNIASIENGEIKHLWQIGDVGYFNNSVEKIDNMLKNSKIKEPFSAKTSICGSKPNVDNYDENITWTHFYAKIPSKFTNIFGRDIGQSNAIAEVFERSLTEANIEDIDLILENIGQIYRMNEFEEMLKSWKNDIIAHNNSKNKDLFIWSEVLSSRKYSLKYRNTVVGTLVTDLFEGVPLDEAVKSFESKVAPENYKRPTAFITPGMIKEAEKKLNELGLSEKIYRRFARENELPTNQILFKTNNKKSLNVFEDMMNDSRKSTKNAKIDKEISLKDFISNLSNVSNVEILPVTQLRGNQVVLTNGESGLFKWSNGFAWSYINGVGGADAIKERVKSLGGNVDAEMRISLSWHNADDLDLHLRYINGLGNNEHIYYMHKESYCDDICLDIDMNVHSSGNGFDDQNPVENIYINGLDTLKDGRYEIGVDNFKKRDNTNCGFDIEVEIQGQRYFYHSDKSIGDSKYIVFEKNGNSFKPILVSEKISSSTVIGDKFIEVKKIIKSPNFWEDNVGNKHLFFITDDYEINKPVSGFYNEFLVPELESNRKVTAVLSDKLKISEGYEDALRGYGFSETMKTEFIVRVTEGNNKTLYKIIN